MSSITSEISNYKEIIVQLIKTSIDAGKEILKIYETDFEVEHKSDDSLLTMADKKSNEVIQKVLTTMKVGNRGSIPILSEESKMIDYNERKSWDLFWLVDPLDGTKEFVKKNGEFTVNISLIGKCRPIMGIVYSPVLDLTYFGFEGNGSYLLSESLKLIESIADNKTDSELYDIITEKSQKLPLENPREKSRLIVVASRSHFTKEVQQYIDDKKKEFDEVETKSIGSSLKLCLVAEGTADVYPRFGPTMEWDTAAAHAVVSSAGKKVLKADSSDELEYNKENLLNPWFIVK